MKKIYSLLFLVFLLTPVVLKAESYLHQKDSFLIAKAVKLGRTRLNPSYSNSSLAGESEIALSKECSQNCKSCNTLNGICSACETGYYLENNKCVTCPSNALCNNGISFICNNFYYKSGSKCVGICIGVSCLNGYTPTPSSAKCCCSQ